MADISDWRCVSQHYCQNLVENAIDRHKLHEKFNPTIILSMNGDALAIAHMLRELLKARTGTAPMMLTHDFEVYDEDMNPLQAHKTPMTGSLGGHRILLVDKVDDSRASMAHFMAKLQARIDDQKAQAAGGPFATPEVAVFVLHNKKKVKAADLPPEMLEGRYFAAEEDSDNVAMSFPFSLHAGKEGHYQPAIHGDHNQRPTSRNAQYPPHARKSLEESRMGTNQSPALDTRLVSSHYVEEAVEKAVDEQKMMETFPPTLIIAVNDDALALARFFRGYMKFKGSAEVPILNSSLKIYDETSVYHPLGDAWDVSALQGHRILLVDKVASTRVTLCQFIEQLRGSVVGAAQQAQAAGTTWADPTVGVFVLQSRDNQCTAQLPQDITDGRFFVAEHIGDVHTTFPFHVDHPNAAVPTQA